MFKANIAILAHCLVLPSEIEKKSSILPQSIQRRMTHASKLALIASQTCLSKGQADYLCFASQHGELDNAVSTLHSIAKQEIFSPIKFSQSVHNSASGLFSILNKTQSAATSIAAGKDTFFMALLDAVCWLAQHKGKNVLLTLYDQPMHDIYRTLAINYKEGYAVSFLLRHCDAFETPADQFRLCITSHTADDIINNKQPPALEFMDLLAANKNNFALPSKSYLFHWQKKIC